MNYRAGLASVSRLLQQPTAGSYKVGAAPSRASSAIRKQVIRHQRAHHAAYVSRSGAADSRQRRSSARGYPP